MSSSGTGLVRREGACLAQHILTASFSWLVWGEAVPGQQHGKGMLWVQASLTVSCLGLAAVMLGCGHVRAFLEIFSSISS